MNVDPQQANYQPAYLPPPPPVFTEDGFGVTNNSAESGLLCIKCGKSDAITMRSFKKKYVSPIAILGIFIGILPYFLFRLLLTTTHQITAPFCEKCWNGRFERVGMVNQLSILIFLASILLGIGVAVNFASPLSFFIIFGFGMLSVVFAKFFEWKFSPKFKMVDGEKVVIDAPSIGEVTFRK